MGYNIDVLGIIINVAAVFVGLFIYVKIMKSDWGQEHRNLQFVIMFIALFAAILIGWGVRTLVTFLILKAQTGA